MMRRSMILAAALLAATATASAHDADHFSAGVPGNAKKPARTVTVVMSDGDGMMKFTPNRLNIKKGEQVRFVIENKGALKHEFTLASVKDNDKHAEMMKKFPDMEHDDPNAKSVDPGKTLSFGIGGATYKGYQAVALGGEARINQNLKVKGGVGLSSGGNTVGMGASYQW